MIMIAHYLIEIIQMSDPHLKSIRCLHTGSIITQKRVWFGKKRNRISVAVSMMMIRVEAMGFRTCFLRA